ncbi:hypothetical protein TREMEDRAFT_58044 [Tremella mesenterica DSM 1558]|uniref:uncharacterized protein n=1 Tax=Tremella mesenterica (strain ATCC 24925 / CBS 8224 / DSM 1558 / NBRC 9311 / NRRL Y-6157 / RJB 2259-6 / UBC 559-6) TaxID=578456 RepID=UPI0003F4964C|nr:uncharacterized protein TREMEDRAFT_58044 [Tremella mesenterica DSM 1558]EIW71910.1 hypothetical protein TREMEDRAFT_58044 [Tremella mesenterica DSM 1558]
MFFSDDLLTSKKGSLIATLGPRTKRITRKQLSNIDLTRTCDLIAQPPEPMALRLSSCLLVGVARVHSQNYEVFYSDVTQFHTALNRAILTDTTTTASGGTGGLDIPGGGKSRIEQITYAGVDVAWHSTFDFNFFDLEWCVPSGGKKRRSTPKLSSLGTQESKDVEESGEESEDDDDEPDPPRVDKRRKVTSSPGLGQARDPTRLRPSLYEVRSSQNLLADLEFPIGEEIDLNLNFDDPSFSAPSGRGMVLPADDVEMGLVGDQLNMEFGEDLQPNMHSTPPPQTPRHTDGSRVKSALKGNNEAINPDQSLEDIEQVLEERPKKAKIMRKVRFDVNLELGQEQLDACRRNYGSSMAREREDQMQKEDERRDNNLALILANSAGLVPIFYETELQDLFINIAKVERFKWERDLSAQKAGKKYVPSNENQEKDPADVFGPYGQIGPTTFEEPSYQEVYHDYEEPVHSRPLRPPSQDFEVEAGRNVSQGSQQVILPWADTSFSDGGMPLGDTSFTPGTSIRKLSVMTPLEQRIRQGSIASDASNPRYRRSSSVLADRGVEPRMLGEDDLELPQLDLDVEGLDTQKSYSGLPEAFRPEMLATLEKQCRDFFSFVETKMIEVDSDQITFGDVSPRGIKKHVAALAFYNCLTLATKHIVRVVQEVDYGGFVISFTAQA